MNVSLKHGLILTGVLVVGMTIGGGVFAIVAKRSQSSTVPSQWFTLPSAKNVRDLILVDEDQAPLRITKMDGTVKFLSVASYQGWPINTLGYVIHVTLGQNDLPDWKNANYEVEFNFSLLNKDGFEIMKFDSIKQSVKAGSSVDLQGHTEAPIDSRIAEKTANVAYRMHVLNSYP
jgi:hypothetical protein